jgi:hypothetical protein
MCAYVQNAPWMARDWFKIQNSATFKFCLNFKFQIAYGRELEAKVQLAGYCFSIPSSAKVHTLKDAEVRIFRV